MARPTWPAVNRLSEINPIPRDIKLGLKVLHVMNHREANFSTTGLNCLETEHEETDFSGRGSLLKELCLKAPIHRVNSMSLGSAEVDRLITGCKILAGIEIGLNEKQTRHVRPSI